MSLPPFNEMNLGGHVGDQPSAVRANRELFAQTIRAHPVFLTQVHGWNVVALSERTSDGVVADACATVQVGLACTVMVADCLPVLFAHRKFPFVAAAHAGWRGLAGINGYGVLESVLQHILNRASGPKAAAELGSITQTLDPADLLVWLGPCIGPDQFEVGPEVCAAFLATHSAAEPLFKPHANGKWLADLPGLARMRLHALGVHHIFGNDGGNRWCTVTQSSRFFSHRRDGSRTAVAGGTGRMAAGIWIV